MVQRAILQPRILHTLELAMAIGGQTLLLAGGWGFLGTVLAYNPLFVSDHVAGLMASRPTETTWITTLIATVLSVATTTYAFVNILRAYYSWWFTSLSFLSIAFKEALRHRMHNSISLIHLSGGIALARGSLLISFRHRTTSLVTLVVFGLTRLLVSSWATLLAPDHITWNVGASGSELDLTSSWFESTLQQELVQSGAALVRGNSSEIIDVGGVLSGIAAAEYSFGTPGILNFNGAKYNISTGGVLPAAPSYGGTTQPASDNNTGLAFAGGLVPTHLNINFSNGQASQGLSQDYTLLQQGLTANVTCLQLNATTGNLNFSSTFQPIPVPLANGTTDYWLWAWNITGNCSEGQPSQQQYVTRSNSSSVPQDSLTGFISSLICPYPLRQTGFSWEHFTLTTNASGTYNFLPLAICTIDPLITTSLVTYSGGVINTIAVSSQPLGNGNTNLTQFLAAIVDYQSRNTQGLTTNYIGDAMYSLYVSASGNNSSNPEDVTNLLLEELEQYWRGVIEFSGTFLRSAFSAYPLTVPDNAQIALSGNETITTMGWYRRSATYGYTIIPITIVALMLYASVAYTLWNIYTEQGRGKSFTTFDPSNPVHVMMVSSVRGSPETEDDLGDALGGFERKEIRKNENVQVELTDAANSRKRFRVVPDVKTCLP